MRVVYSGIGVALLVLVSMHIRAQEAEYDHPRYKPASRAPSAMDIRTNRYGASRSAPNALEIGDKAQDFSAPVVGGGSVSLGELLEQGDVVLIFYRGHW